VSPNIVRVDYDTLENIAGRFARQAESVLDTHRRLERNVQELQNGGWVGKGAIAFFKEMEKDIFPAMMRLRQALEQAQSVTLQMKSIMKATEEEVASLFKNDASSNSGGDSWKNESAASVKNSSTTNGGERPGLDKAFADFKVPEGDKDGMIKVPDEWIANLFGLQRRSVTMTEKRMMDEIGLFGDKKLYDIQKESYEMAEKFAGTNGQEDGLGDAYRHAYWNALMTREFGPDWAKRYSDAHENLPGNPKSLFRKSVLSFYV
jgi:WXG100 family type VII secretion target